MHSFSSRVVIITGGGAGIGRAAALKFATQGDQVIVTGRRPDPLHALAEEHRNIGFVIADAGNPEDAARTVREVTDRFGRLDVIVNNAGAGSLLPASSPMKLLEFRSAGTAGRTMSLNGSPHLPHPEQHG